MNKPFIFPIPKSTKLFNGVYCTEKVCTVNMSEDLQAIFHTVQSIFPETKIAASADGAVILQKSNGYSAEGYSITVSQEGIKIVYSEPSGAFYALVTLCQLLQQGDGIPYCRIDDEPGLKIRGVMMDISRGKVPKLDTLKWIADRLAQFKINHFELYIEGLSFAYPRYKALWAEETPLMPEEICALSEYCRERFIDLVPCQNGLGHMSRWLSVEQFNHLAECPDGFAVKGFTIPPTTLDPEDEGSTEFVKELYEALLPCFKSNYVNACLDEPFELCMGKNKGKNKYQLYTDYANRMNGFVKSRGGKMMMWGDVLAKNSETLNALDKDIIILDWGYEKEHPYDKRAERLSRADRKFCLCPGTNSWLSFTGMTDNMLACIESAANAAYSYGAQGIIVTDWGDCGHLQYLPVSWAGILTAAAYAWNMRGTDRETLAKALDRFVFQDSACVLGNLVLDAGNYYQSEEFLLPCRTLAATVLTSGFVSREEYEKSLAFTAKSISFFSTEDFVKIYLESYQNRKEPRCFAVRKYLQELVSRLKRAKPACADGEIVLREYHNGLQMADAMCKVREMMLTGARFPELEKQLDTVISEHRRLWNIRNKPYGCAQGLTPLEQIRKQLEDCKKGEI